jgi:hypothetical protein
LINFNFLSGEGSIMTTLYIEEVTSSDDEVEQEEEEEEEEEEMDDEKEVIRIENKNADDDIVMTANARRQQCNETKFKFQAETLHSCPIAIGGGASFSIIHRKGYVFGGCSRSGIPSSEVHSFDFGTS